VGAQHSGSAAKFVSLIFDGGFDDFAAWEAETRCYRTFVWAKFDDGSWHQLSFFELIRLTQELDLSRETFFMETGLIIVPEVTLANMEHATRALAAEGLLTSIGVKVPSTPSRARFVRLTCDLESVGNSDSEDGDLGRVSARIELDDETCRTVTFYSVPRLAHVLNEAWAVGAVFFTEPNLVVVQRLNLATMNTVAQSLIEQKCFDNNYAPGEFEKLHPMK